MASHLHDVDVDELSGVKKGANDKKFFLFKSAEPVSKMLKQEDDGWCVYSEDGAKKLGGPYPSKKHAQDRLAEIEAAKAAKVGKQDKPGLLGIVRDALRKAAGASGPDDGGTEMQFTLEDVKKAVAESLAEGLAPIDARLTAVEKRFEEEPPVSAAAPADGTPTDLNKDGDEPAPAAGELTEEVLKSAISEGVKEGLKDITARVEKLENAAGQRQSGNADDAHGVQKAAGGKFSWAGSGLL